MPSPNLSLSFSLRYTPLPAILRGIAAYRKALKGGLTPHSPEVELPQVFTTAGSNYRLTIGAEAYELLAAPLDRIDRFGPSATSLCQLFLKSVKGIAPREVALKAELRIPIPDPQALGGYAIASFAWPRKVELRPEALGKDHFLPTETGMIHLRLSVHSWANAHELHLVVSNRHDRVSADPNVIDQAYALCMRGIIQVVQACTASAYKRMLLFLLTPEAKP